jgi:hypothetical protein
MQERTQNEELDLEPSDFADRDTVPAPEEDDIDELGDDDDSDEPVIDDDEDED